MANPITLMEFPYPYKAMLSISNDIDSTSWEEFLSIHKELMQMNFPLGDSIFIYQIPEADEYAFSYAKYPLFSLTPQASTIREMILRGQIEAIHTFGNHSIVGGFAREMGQKSLALMGDYDLHFPIWINHGDSENRQNLISSSGNNPNSEAYIADLLPALGVKYLWVGDLSDFVGQGRKLTLKDTYFAPDIKRYPFSGTVRFLKYILKGIITLGQPLDHAINELMYPICLQDGSKFWAFRRFGKWNKSKRDDLPFLLSEKNLKILCSLGGYMIIYMHLGKKNRTDSTIFSKEETDAIKRLKACNDRKEILITTTGKLLDFHRVRQGVKWSIVNSSQKTVIDIDKVQDSILGDFIPEPRELKGLTFFVKGVSKTEIRLRGRPIDFQVFEANSKDRGYIGILWAVEN